MVATKEVNIEKDLANKKITITKHFDAKVDDVWQAWTKKEILDKWWAPHPWRSETNKMEFQEGGSWQYAMVGPENERHHGKFQYLKIRAPKSYEGVDSFTDERGFINPELPQAQWKVEFKSAGAGTDVKITVTPKSEGALEKFLEMRFEEGFKQALGNLDDYFETRA
jgi:uncharacterized protein YndB with AHSA1/START domain